MASDIPLLPQSFIHRVEKWADKRQPDVSASALIDQQHLYILPSKAGLVFFFVLLIIFIGAINYENNMAFLLCFLLASVSLLSMLYTHLNINGLQIQASPAPSVFAGQTAQYPLRIKHTNPRDSIYIQIEADKNPPIIIHQLKADTDTSLLLPVKTSRRGHLALPRIKVYTEYPLGLFYAWSWIKLSADCVVYPAISQQESQPVRDRHQAGTSAYQIASGQDDFDHLRDYQIGDNPAHIAWKTYARSSELFTKTFTSSSGQDIWIDWFSLPQNISVEDKLSILCKQIIEASQLDIHYGLRLPDQSINCATGLQHRHQCLRALALFA